MKIYEYKGQHYKNFKDAEKIMLEEYSKISSVLELIEKYKIPIKTDISTIARIKNGYIINITNVHIIGYNERKYIITTLNVKD